MMVSRCATFLAVKRAVPAAPAGGPAPAGRPDPVVDGGASDADVDVLVVGAGVSGLGFVGFWKDACAAAGRDPGRILVVEREREPGGWCRSIQQDGFVWDYAGHFFHFRHADLRQRLRDRLPPDALVDVVKRARVVDVEGCETSFPYQRALGELPPAAFRRCLADLWAAERAAPRAPGPPPSSFRARIAARLGAGICERFLFPYNEKLYATDLDALDADCMGRFFPTTSFADVMDAVAGLHDAVDGDGAYNATFTYPRDGAIAYVRALQQDVAPGELALQESLVSVDPARRMATTTRRRVAFRQLVTSAPLPATLRACGVDHAAPLFSHSRVLVFNLGFDRKGRDDVHWMYFADRSLPFYRVGFYDNILGGDRMSLYVEIGLPARRGAGDGVGDGVDDGLDDCLDDCLDPAGIEAWRGRVLAGLQRVGLVDGHRLVAWHHVVMDPAYVHLTAAGMAETARTRALLSSSSIHAVGRYGGWTYCSIEDNLVEARALAQRLALERPR
jgi:protoporphyrinogen oxidase